VALLPSPDPRPEPKPTLSIRIEITMRDLLDSYCEFAQCGRPHIIQEALRLAFQQDTDFQRWLEMRRSSSISTPGSGQDDAVQHSSR